MNIINEKTVDMTFDEFCRGGKSITPGPWHFVIEDDERKIAAPPKSKDYKREILMCDAAYYPHCPNEDADWRLIAAAPELLKALLYFLDDREVVDFGEWVEEGRKIAKKAIAKVEGRL